MTQGKPEPGVPVWDPLVRAGHWALAAAVTLAWFTREGWGAWHEAIGYVCLALVAIRIAWGGAGSPRARFSRFVKPPAATLEYARRVLAHREPRYLGHNPLGAWMILALLATVALTGLTGWLYTTDAYWGVEWVGDLHDGLADLVLALVALHIAGVAFTSIRQRENLVAAMIHGRKRPPAGNDVA